MLAALVDENIPLRTVAALRHAGHDVADLRGTALAGVGDDVIWNKAQRERRLLITTDKGFATLRDQPHHGVLIVRLKQPNRHRIHTSHHAGHRRDLGRRLGRVAGGHARPSSE